MPSDDRIFSVETADMTERESWCAPGAERASATLEDDGGERDVFHMVVTTLAMNDNGYVVVPQGGDLLRMQKHPGVFLNHQGWGNNSAANDEMDRMPIGHRLASTVSQTVLAVEADMVFDVFNPVETQRNRALLIESLVRDGTLTGVSMGWKFRRGGDFEEMTPLEMEDEFGVPYADMGFRDDEKRKGFDVAREWVHMEDGIVSIPANAASVVSDAKYRLRAKKGYLAALEGKWDESKRHFDKAAVRLDELAGVALRKAYVPIGADLYCDEEEEEKVHTEPPQPLPNTGRQWDRGVHSIITDELAAEMNRRMGISGSGMIDIPNLVNVIPQPTGIGGDEIARLVQDLVKALDE